MYLLIQSYYGFSMGGLIIQVGVKITAKTDLQVNVIVLLPIRSHPILQSKFKWHILSFNFHCDFEIFIGLYLRIRKKVICMQKFCQIWWWQTKDEIIRLYEDDKTIGPSYCALRRKKWPAVMMTNLKMTKNEDDNGNDKKYRAFIPCLRRET